MKVTFAPRSAVVGRVMSLHRIVKTGRDLWRAWSPTPATSGSPGAGDTGPGGV